MALRLQIDSVIEQIGNMVNDSITTLFFIRRFDRVKVTTHNLVIQIIRMIKV